MMMMIVSSTCSFVHGAVAIRGRPSSAGRGPGAGVCVCVCVHACSLTRGGCHLDYLSTQEPQEQVANKLNQPFQFGGLGAGMKLLQNSRHSDNLGW